MLWSFVYLVVRNLLALVCCWRGRAGECLDRILIVGRRHLEQVMRGYITHYNNHRPHRSLERRPPLAKPPPAGQPPPNSIARRDRLGGLLHEYYAIAA